MHGVVENGLLAFLCRHLGREKAESIYQDLSLHTPFVDLLSYPDSSFFEVVQAASSLLQLSPNQLLRWFGTEFAIIILKKGTSLWHNVVAIADDLGAFLRSIDSIYSSLVLVMPLLHPPGIHVAEMTEHSCRLDFLPASEERRLMEPFLEGLLVRIGRHYGVTVKVSRVAHFDPVSFAPSSFRLQWKPRANSKRESIVEEFQVYIETKQELDEEYGVGEEGVAAAAAGGGTPSLYLDVGGDTGRVLSETSNSSVDEGGEGGVEHHQYHVQPQPQQHHLKKIVETTAQMKKNPPLIPQPVMGMSAQCGLDILENFLVDCGGGGGLPPPLGLSPTRPNQTEEAENSGGVSSSSGANAPPSSSNVSSSNNSSSSNSQKHKKCTVRLPDDEFDTVPIQFQAAAGIAATSTSVSSGSSSVGGGGGGGGGGGALPPATTGGFPASSSSTTSSPSASSVRRWNSSERMSFTDATPRSVALHITPTTPKDPPSPFFQAAIDNLRTRAAAAAAAAGSNADPGAVKAADPVPTVAMAPATRTRRSSSLLAVASSPDHQNIPVVFSSSQQIQRQGSGGWGTVQAAARPVENQSKTPSPIKTDQKIPSLPIEERQEESGSETPHESVTISSSTANERINPSPEKPHSRQSTSDASPESGFPRSSAAVKRVVMDELAEVSSVHHRDDDDEEDGDSGEGGGFFDMDCESLPLAKAKNASAALRGLSSDSYEEEQMRPTLLSEEKKDQQPPSSSSLPSFPLLMSSSASSSQLILGFSGGGGTPPSAYLSAKAALSSSTIPESPPYHKESSENRPVLSASPSNQQFQQHHPFKQFLGSSPPGGGSNHNKMQSSFPSTSSSSPPTASLTSSLTMMSPGTRPPLSPSTVTCRHCGRPITMFGESAPVHSPGSAAKTMFQSEIAAAAAGSSTSLSPPSSGGGGAAIAAAAISSTIAAADNMLWRRRKASRCCEACEVVQRKREAFEAAARLQAEADNGEGDVEEGGESSDGGCSSSVAPAFRSSASLSSFDESAGGGGGGGGAMGASRYPKDFDQALSVSSNESGLTGSSGGSMQQQGATGLVIRNVDVYSPPFGASNPNNAPLGGKFSLMSGKAAAAMTASTTTGTSSSDPLSAASSGSGGGGGAGSSVSVFAAMPPDPDITSRLHPPRWPPLARVFRTKTYSAPAQFPLPAENLKEVFPFHIIADNKLRVLQVGRSLNRVLPDVATGKNLSECVSVEEPSDVPLDFSAISAAGDSAFVLLGHNGVRLKGQMTVAALDGCAAPFLYFLCSPVLASFQDVEELGLQSTDFSAVDSSRDNLLLRGAMGSVADGAALLANALRELKREKTRVEGLLQQLQQKNKELAEARDAAVRNTELKSKFLANTSHELRTPLNGIIGMTSLLMDTVLTPQQKQFVQVAKVSGEALLSIVNDILDISKIESGKLRLERIPFNLIHLVEGVADTVSFQACEAGIDLIIDIHPSAPAKLKGDPGRLRQILLNLVSNAVKFTKKGMVIISVSVINETVTALKRRKSYTSDSSSGPNWSPLNIKLEELWPTQSPAMSSDENFASTPPALHVGAKPVILSPVATKVSAGVMDLDGEKGVTSSILVRDVPPTVAPSANVKISEDEGKQPQQQGGVVGGEEGDGKGSEGGLKRPILHPIATETEDSAAITVSVTPGCGDNSSSLSALHQRRIVYPPSIPPKLLIPSIISPRSHNKLPTELTPPPVPMIHHISPRNSTSAAAAHLKPPLHPKSAGGSAAISPASVPGVAASSHLAFPTVNSPSGASTSSATPALEAALAAESVSSSSPTSNSPMRAEVVSIARFKFTVTDTGCGIPPDKLGHLFEPFVQASASISRTHGGTGLGLSICKQLAKLFHGDITVVSRESKGSVFAFDACLIVEDENEEDGGWIDHSCLLASCVVGIYSPISLLSQSLARLCLPFDMCPQVFETVAEIPDYIRDEVPKREKEKEEEEERAEREKRETAGQMRECCEPIEEHAEEGLASHGTASVATLDDYNRNNNNTNSSHSRSEVEKHSAAGGEEDDQHLSTSVKVRAEIKVDEDEEGGREGGNVHHHHHEYDVDDEEEENIIDSDYNNRAVKEVILFVEMSAEDVEARLVPFLPPRTKIIQIVSRNLPEIPPPFFGAIAKPFHTSAVQDIFKVCEDRAALGGTPHNNNNNRNGDGASPTCASPINNGGGGGSGGVGFSRERSFVLDGGEGGERDPLKKSTTPSHHQRALKWAKSRTASWSSVDKQSVTSRLDLLESLEDTVGRQMDVLVVEDNRINMMVAQGTLTSFGLTGTAATNGQEAVDLFKKGRTFDVVLMDVQMPIMDGIEATRQIRALSLAKQPNIIALTGATLREEAEQCKEAGMDGYLCKPLNRKLLAGILTFVAPDDVVPLDLSQFETMPGDAFTLEGDMYTHILPFEDLFPVHGLLRLRQTQNQQAELASVRDPSEKGTVGGISPRGNVLGLGAGGGAGGGGGGGAVLLERVLSAEEEEVEIAESRVKQG